MTHMARNSRIRAFTLIELLVVVAIIAVLISILLPSLSGARKQAKKLLCLTQQKSLGEVTMMYAHDNNDRIMRGIRSDRDRNGNGIPREWGTYWTSVLKLLHYDGRLTDGNGRGIWNFGQNQRWLMEVTAKIPQFQCPSHPNDAPLDYVASALPIPYTTANARSDVRGGGQNGDGMQGEFGPPDYMDLYRINEIDRYGPGRLVFITEAHESVFRIFRDTIRFNHFFYGSQLPFGAFPRIANDPRHNGQINSLFFDGHAVSMSLKQFDIGWPNELELRMKWVTTPIEDGG